MTPPHRPSAVLEHEVLVEYRMFSLIDPDSDYWASDPGIDAGRILTIDRGRAWFHSAANDHYAHVRVELWSTPPPGNTTNDAHDTASITITGHRVCLATVEGPVTYFSDPDTPTELHIDYLPIPAPGQHRLAVSVHGREHAAHLPEASWQHAIETWLIKIWPAPDTPS